MAQFTVRLSAVVRVPVSAEVTIQAADEDAAAKGAIEEAKHQDAVYVKAYEVYHATMGAEFPKKPFFWDADADDIEENLDWDDVEVDRVELAKEPRT
jgi:hypothetical protein